MIMADLKTNYVDDVLDTTKNQLRKYQQIQNDDGTVSFVDVTEYTQVGTSFGAKDINDTNAAINDVNRKLNEWTKIADNISVSASSGQKASLGVDLSSYNELIVTTNGNKFHFFKDSSGQFVTMNCLWNNSNQSCFVCIQILKENNVFKWFHYRYLLSPSSVSASPLNVTITEIYGR